jgi:methyl-accepting chemotaxis protein-1 (serine sensor receptor)
MNFGHWLCRGDVMGSLSTKQRILGTIGLLIAVLVAVGAVGHVSSRKLNDALAFNYDNYFVAESQIAEIISRQRAVNEEILAATLARTPAAVSMTKSKVSENRARIKKLWEGYRATDLTDEEDKLGAEFADSRERLLEINEKVLSALDQGNFDSAAGIIASESRSKTNDTMERGDHLLAYLSDHAALLKKQSDEMYRANSVVMETMMAVGVSVALLLGWLLARSILSALQQGMSVAGKIAAGELGHDIHVDRSDEFGQLLQALKTMDTKLVSIVSEVLESADRVGSSARQLAEGNDDLSGRTQQQAAALEETASSMEEMTATVKQNADSAKQASRLASSARGQASSSADIANRAVQAMGEINSSSRKIADIIGVIDEIAFQTNLLALNAAVEAARAGEQGRGFAVVATEVRTLAQRSAVAAKEIKDLINDSVEKVKNGSDYVNQSGEALGQIVASIKKVTDIVEGISAASQEQASGIDQVNDAVTQMDTATQQNAALVEEASAASKSMQTQAEDLVRQVAFFRVNGGGVRKPADVVRRPAPLAVVPKRPAPVRQQQRASSPAPLARASGDDSNWEEF